LLKKIIKAVMTTARENLPVTLFAVPIFLFVKATQALSKTIKAKGREDNL